MKLTVDSVGGDKSHPGTIFPLLIERGAELIELPSELLDAIIKRIALRLDLFLSYGEVIELMSLPDEIFAPIVSALGRTDLLESIYIEKRRASKA